MNSTPQQNDQSVTGQSGTLRIDTVQGPAGTARVTADRGPAGTARVTADRVSDGTARVGDGAQTGPAAATTANWHLAVGQTVEFNGRSYSIDRELTTNTGEARTYIVRQAGRQLVLKQYRPGIHAPNAVLARIQSIPHRNVIEIIDFGPLQGQDFEILSYVTGGTLDQLLRSQGPLRDITRLRLLATQLVDGLTHLHEEVGLIYQDLKPENILISGSDLLQVVLTDFGISSLRQAGSPDVQVTANGTREYAAPELARFGNETKTFVTDKVDYFALGITLLECWQGSRPFQSMVEGRRAALIQDREVPFPPGMEPSLEVLIKGLISPGPKDRFGQEHVRRWIAGLPLTVDYQGTARKYEVKHFPSGESFENPLQLAVLMEKYPEVGKDFLYYDSIQKWLDASGDMGLSTEIRKVVVEYGGRTDKEKDAGLLRAIYVLDKDRLFTSAGGQVCATLEEMADALLAEKDHYASSLSSAFDPFYLYLHARGEGEFAAETQSKFVSSKYGDLAFNQLIYAMQAGGRNRVRIAGHYYFLPEELNDAPPEIHAEVLAALQQYGSRVLLWLQRLGHIEKVAPIGRAEPRDQLGIVCAMPWVRLAEFAPDLASRQGWIAIDLLANGRTDLFDSFLAQGLSFNAVSNEGGVFQKGITPINYAVINRLLDALDYMIRHGGDLEMAQPKGGRTPLNIACLAREGPIIDLLLAGGADPNPVNIDGWTNLGFAVSHNGKVLGPVDNAIVQKLIDAGAHVNQPFDGDKLPLHEGLVNGSPDEILHRLEMLLHAGSDIHRMGVNVVLKDQPPCNAWFTALFAYHKYSDKEAAAYLPVLERLLQVGARVEDLYQGKAALHWAAEWSDEALVKFLLAHGARATQVGDDDMLPGTYAKQTGAKAIVNLLDPGLQYSRRGLTSSLKSKLWGAFAILLLLPPLLSLGEQVPALFRTGSVMYLWQPAVAAFLIAQALRSIATDVWAAIKVKLGSAGGWIALFAMEPALICALATLVAILTVPYVDEHPWLRLLTQHGWIALGIALFVTFIAVRSSTRAAQITRPLKKYQTAQSREESKDPVTGRNTLVMMFVLLLLIATPVGLIFWKIGHVSETVTEGPSPAGSGPVTGTVKRDTRIAERQKKATAEQ